MSTKGFLSGKWFGMKAQLSELNALFLFAASIQ